MLKTIKYYRYQSVCLICTYGLSCHPSGRVPPTSHPVNATWEAGEESHLEKYPSAQKRVKQIGSNRLGACTVRTLTLSAPKKEDGYTSASELRGHEAGMGSRKQSCLVAARSSPLLLLGHLRKARPSSSRGAGSGLSRHVSVRAPFGNFTAVFENKHLPFQQTTQDLQYLNSQRKCNSQESCDFQCQVMGKVTFFITAELRFLS